MLRFSSMCLAIAAPIFVMLSIVRCRRSFNAKGSVGLFTRGNCAISGWSNDSSCASVFDGVSSALESARGFVFAGAIAAFCLVSSWEGTESFCFGWPTGFSPSSSSFGRRMAFRFISS